MDQSRRQLPSCPSRPQQLEKTPRSSWSLCDTKTQPSARVIKPTSPPGVSSQAKQLGQRPRCLSASALKLTLAFLPSIGRYVLSPEGARLRATATSELASSSGCVWARRFLRCQVPRSDCCGVSARTNLNSTHQQGIPQAVAQIREVRVQAAVWKHHT